MFGLGYIFTQMLKIFRLNNKVKALKIKEESDWWQNLHGPSIEDHIILLHDNPIWDLNYD